VFRIRNCLRPSLVCYIYYKSSSAYVKLIVKARKPCHIRGIDLVENRMRSVVLISIILFVLYGSLWPPAIAFINKATVVSDEGTLSLSGTSGPLYYTNASAERTISWTVNTTSSNSITYQLLHNGTLLQDGVLGSGEYNVLYTIKPSVLSLATHNFTLVATDEIETKSWTLLVTIYYSSSSTSVDMAQWSFLIAVVFGASVIMYLSYSQRIWIRVPPSKYSIGVHVS